MNGISRENPEKSTSSSTNSLIPHTTSTILHSVTNDTSTTDPEKPALLLADSASDSKKADSLQDQLPENPDPNGNDTSGSLADIEHPSHYEWSGSEFGRNVKKCLQTKKESKIFGNIFQGHKLDAKQIHVVVTNEHKYVLRPSMKLSWMIASLERPKSLYRLLENCGPLQEHSLFALGWLSEISKEETSEEDTSDEAMLRERYMRFIVAVDVTDTLLSLWLIYDYNVGLKNDHFVTRDLRTSIAQYFEPSLDEIEEAYWANEDAFGQNKSVTKFSQLFNPEKAFDLGNYCSDIGTWNASTGLQVKRIQELLPENSYLNGSSMRRIPNPSCPYEPTPLPHVLSKLESPLKPESSPDLQLLAEVKRSQALIEPLLSEGKEIRDQIHARLMKQYKTLEDLNRIFNHELRDQESDRDDLSVDTRAYERVIKALG